MIDPFSALPADHLDVEELARLTYAKRLRLTTSSGLSGVVHRGGDPDLVVGDLIRLAAIGQAFIGAAFADPGRTLRSIRDGEARATDARVHALLQGRPLLKSGARAC